MINSCELNCRNQKGSRTSHDEKVCIPRRGEQDIQRTDRPLDEQSSHWSAERPITCEKRRPRKNPLTAKFLDNPSVGEHGGQVVSQSGQCDHEAEYLWIVLYTSRARIPR